MTTATADAALGKESRALTGLATLNDRARTELTDRLVAALDRGDETEVGFLMNALRTLADGPPRFPRAAYTTLPLEDLPGDGVSAPDEPAGEAQ